MSLNPKVGDILVGKDGYRVRVLAVCGEMVATSYTDNHEGFCIWNTLKGLENNGWTVEQPAKPEYPEVGEEVWAIIDWQPYELEYSQKWNGEIAIGGWYRSKEEAEDAIKKISAFVKGGLK